MCQNCAWRVTADVIQRDILGGRFHPSDKARFANVYALIVSEEHAHSEQRYAVAAFLGGRHWPDGTVDWGGECAPDNRGSATAGLCGVPLDLNGRTEDWNVAYSDESLTCQRCRDGRAKQLQAQAAKLVTSKSRTLVAAAKANFGSGEDERAASWLRERSSALIVSAESIDWQTIKANEGSWEGSYRWAAREHGAIVLLPTDYDGEYPIARGQFAMLAAFLSYRKPVGVWTGDKVQRMTTFEEVKKNWKTRYARLFV